MSVRSLILLVCASVLVVGCEPVGSLPGKNNTYYPPQNNNPSTNNNDPNTNTNDPNTNNNVPNTNDNNTNNPTPDAGVPNSTPDSGTPNPGNTAPGGECNCDSDCQAVDGHAGICVLGICMTQPSAPCSAAGSTAECATGSRCWGLSGWDGYICWPDCASYTCDGACDGDGSCVMTQSTSCDYNCGTYCPCEPGDCAANEQCIDGECVFQCTGPQDCDPGESCVNGSCITDVGNGPGPGPGPVCSSLPPLECTGTAQYCGELVPFDPDYGDGYIDYPENGETWNNQYRSYIRRDVMMLVKYAAAKVACQTAGWTFGDNWEIGLIDMSEADGSIPGTSINQPGHPTNTHTDGFDIDIAYYQLNQADNAARPVCDHYLSNVDQYHCTGDPDDMDPWRNALFIGALSEHPYLRVIGVDGKIGPLVESAIAQLCQDGWIATSACGGVPLAYEVTDQGNGWFRFHHHHMHISFTQPSYKDSTASKGAQCLVPGCAPTQYFYLNARVFQKTIAK